MRNKAYQTHRLISIHAQVLRESCACTAPQAFSLKTTNLRAQGVVSLHNRACGKVFTGGAASTVAPMPTVPTAASTTAPHSLLFRRSCAQRGYRIQHCELSRGLLAASRFVKSCVT